MRFLHSVALVTAVAFGLHHDNHVVRDDDLRDYIPLFEAYGNLTVAAKSAALRLNLETHHAVAMSSLARSADRLRFEELRSGDNCIFPIELMIIQDLTGSNQGDFKQTILETLPSIARTIPIEHPNSRFSLITFRDKPINQLGETIDDCFTVQTINVEDPMEMEKFLDSEEAGGGWDYPENQYGAIMAALKSPVTIPWRINPLATPVIIMITDSEPHFEGDGRQSLYPQLTSWGTGYDEALAEDYCSKRYYPTPLDVSEALHEEGVYLGTIIVRPEWEGGRALSAWSWFNGYVGNPDGLITSLDDNMDHWFGELSEILTTIKGLECGEIETTTQAPVATEAPTTSLYIPDEKTEAPQGSESVTNPPGGDESTTETTEACSCPDGSDSCCEQQPEVLIAILKRPKVLDVHLQGYASS